MWKEEKMHRTGSSACVNPEIQHIPADLLQRASLLFLTFMFYWNFSAFELLSSGASVLPLTGRTCTRPTAPLHRTSSCFCYSSNHPSFQLTDEYNNNNKVAAHTCAVWFALHRPNTPPPQSQQSVSVIRSVKKQQWAELTEQSNSASVVEVEWALYRDIQIYRDIALPCNVTSSGTSLTEG